MREVVQFNPLFIFDGFTPPSFDEDHRRRALLLSRLCVVFVVLAPITGLITLAVFRMREVGYVVTGLTLPIAAVPWVVRRFRSLAAGVSLLNGSVFVALIASCLYTGGVSQSSTAWLVMLPLVAVAIAGSRTALVWAALAVLLPPVLFALEQAQLVHLHPQTAQLFAEAATANWMILPVAGAALGVLAEELRRAAMARVESAHRELTAAREQQVMTDRLTSIGTLAAGVAHELNNPLATIASSARYLRDEAHEKGWGTEAESAADDVVEAAHRAALVVRDLKAFTQPATDERSFAQLSQAWESAKRLLRPALRHRAAIITELPPDLPTVALPPSRLVQVLLNLLTNAMQAMSLADAEFVSLDATVIDDVVEFRLRDNGAGMSADTVRRAFDPFFTTRQVGGGAGLGLFVVHTIISGCGGSIRLESTPGRGSTVICRLPIARHD